VEHGCSRLLLLWLALPPLSRLSLLCFRPGGAARRRRRGGGAAARRRRGAAVLPRWVCA
jgi:hypothetical protein